MGIWFSSKEISLPACDNFGEVEPGDRTFHVDLATAMHWTDRLRLLVGEDEHPDVPHPGYDVPTAAVYLSADEARALAAALLEIADDLH